MRNEIKKELEAMRHSKAAFRACGALLAAALLFTACDGFFTTSVASFISRDTDYSSLSLEELLKLANSSGQSNSSVAKGVLDALANVSADELTNLTLEEKSSILNTATNAAFDLDSVLDLVDSLIDAEDSSSIIDQVFDLANNDTDMTAVKVILQDEETLQEASVDSLILASAALMTSVDDDDVDSIIAAIDGGDTSSLSDDLKETADIILNVVDVLSGERADEVSSLSDELGFDLSELIPGFGS